MKVFKRFEYEVSSKDPSYTASSFTFWVRKAEKKANLAIPCMFSCSHNNQQYPRKISSFIIQLDSKINNNNFQKILQNKMLPDFFQVVLKREREIEIIGDTLVRFSYKKSMIEKYRDYSPNQKKLIINKMALDIYLVDPTCMISDIQFKIEKKRIVAYVTYINELTKNHILLTYFTHSKNFDHCTLEILN